MDNQKSLTQFVELLRHKDMGALSNFYLKCSTNENIGQLKYLYQQACANEQSYQVLQDLTCALLEKKPMPEPLIAAINTIEKLTFFTPALTASEGFCLQNAQGNTLLHGLFKQQHNVQPPFNYIRSLLLFERNDSLAKALACKNEQKLLPMECYLAFNTCEKPLPDHELTAALALLEAQLKQVSAQADTLMLICNHLKSNPSFEHFDINSHRILLISAAFQCSRQDVLALLG